jgi:hypothetical protein
MTWIRAQVILHTVDAVAENFVTNSWCIETTDVPGPSEFLNLTTCFKDFYDDLNGILAVPIAQNAHEIKYYDLEWVTPPNYPLAVNTFNLTTAPSAATLPSEVAICLSFQGEKVPGFPQARRRGRVYIGPVSQTLNSAGRPTSPLLSQLASSVQTLCSNLKAAPEPAVLSVWSPTDGSGVNIADGWIDNAWDTQRRRGLTRTSRTTWDAP